MMKLVKYKYFNLIVHALAWSLVLFLPYLVSSAESQYKIGLFPGLFFTCSGVVHMVIFYSNALFLYPKLLNRLYWPVYVVSVVVLIFLSYWLKLHVLTTWFPDAMADARNHILFPSVGAFIASMFYSITVDKIRSEKIRKENEALQMEMELKFLRSQISPHFIFNVLTNLVSLAKKKSDNLETSILMLSGLIRYMLYDTSKKITLQREAEYLESYIELQKLRFGHDVKILYRLNLSPDTNDHTIEPMLLIPFVENAFKHGTGYVQEPFVDVSLVVKDSLLILDVRNKHDSEVDKSKDSTSGIGLNNVRSRLNLLYPDRHDLIIQRDENLFTIHLTVKLL